MNKPTREDLLGFVLGALDAQEQQDVAEYLSLHPELQLELQRLQAQLVPLEICRQPSPDFPVGLARRTCEIVARECRQINPSIPSESALPIQPTHKSSPAVSFNRPQSNRAQLLQSALMVCCSAILGAAVGPLAYGALNNSAEPLSSSLVVNRVVPEPKITSPAEPTAATGWKPDFEVAYIGQATLPTISNRNIAANSEQKSMLPRQGLQMPSIRFISK